MTRFRERGGRERHCPSATRLVADAEAFLNGDYAAQLRRLGAEVPGWAQLNLLAHGDLQIIRRTRRPSATTRLATFADRADHTWTSALRMLARELFQMVEGDPEMLSSVQRRVLVPLELELMHESDLTAYELVQFTRAALNSSIP
jgi:hypothetical protein